MPRVPMWRRYATLFGVNAKKDVVDELQFHLDEKIEDLVAQGWDKDAARQEAERQFGNLQALQRMGEEFSKGREQVKRRRDHWGAWWKDAQYAFRTLRRDRGFAAIAVLILALGIAANTAVFSVVNTVLLRALPFPEARQLTWLSPRGLSGALREAVGLSGVTYTVAAYEEYQRHNRSFESLTSYNPFFGNSEYTLTGRGDAQPVTGVMVADNFFEALRVRPVLGRLFTEQECQKGGSPAALLSYPFWQRQFGGDRGIVGQTITLSKQAYTVVGVLPESFNFGAVFAPGLQFDVFVPLVMDVLRTWGNTLAVVGRLKPGVEVSQAQAEAETLFPQLQKAHQDWMMDYTPTITGLKEFVSGKLRRPLIVLWGAVGLILLIVCVNLSNLMLSRSAARSKEFAIRGALGASRGRIVRQLLTESLILSVAGALLGLAGAFALTRYFAHQGSIALPLLNRVSVDGEVLIWTLAITIATAVLFGLAPALKMTQANVQDALKDAGHGMSAGRRHERMRAGLVISEVALSSVLLIGAGLLMRSFLRVLDVDLGFRQERAVAIKIDYDDGNSPERRGAILQEMLRRVEALPGVEAAGVADMLPLGRNRSWELSAKGKSYRKDEIKAAMVRIVTPGYLEAMGMHLREGRDFTWSDTPRGQQVVIVNEAAARRFWQGEDPLGRTALADEERKVVGVISDVKETSLETPPGPEMYLPVTQAGPEGAEMAIRTRLPAAALAGSVMKALRSVNPNEPAAELHPLKRIVDRAASPRRFFVLLVGSFAVLGLVLASLGIYGVISYSVAQRTQEIGIRMALGAAGRQVQLAVVARSMRLALAGLLIGLAVSLAVARSIDSLLFGTSPGDPLTFVSVALLLGAVAGLAGYLPSRRASRIDPAITLRGL